MTVFWCSNRCSAQMNLDHLKDSLRLELSDSERTNIDNKLIKYYSSIGSDSGAFYANDGMTVFTGHHYTRGQAWMMLALGDIDDRNGNSISAVQRLNAALRIFTANYDKSGMARANTLLGIVEGKLGNFDISAQYLLVARKIYDSTGNKEGLLSNCVDFGMVYERLNDSVKALKYYMMADSISQLLPNSGNTIVALNDLGGYYFDHGDTAKAFQYFDKALQFCSSPEYYYQYIITLMNLSSMMYSIGNVYKGHYYSEQALVIAQSHHVKDLEADIMINFVEANLKMSKDTALKNLNDAMAIIRVSGNKYSEMAAYDAYEQIYERTHEFELANRYLKLKQSLYDSLLNVNKAKMVANLMSGYELQQSNSRINRLEKLTDRIRKQERVIVLIALMLIVVCGVLAFYYRKVNHLNKNLEARKKELTDLNNMKDKIFSIIGHDMRAPIANISTLMDLIEADVVLPDEYKEILSTLKDHSNATLETLETLIQLGKSLMKGKNYNPKNFDAKKDIKKCIDLKLVSANKKKLVIEDESPENIMVYGDPVHFDFIIRNLISNAIKFSYEGSKIVIKVQRYGDGYVVFSVKDSGKGINESAMQHIFKSTITSTYGTQNEKGNGIGLMLCAEFVELNTGKIWVESQEGHGATFFFTFKEASVS